MVNKSILFGAFLIAMLILAVPAAANTCSFLTGGKYISVKYGELAPPIGASVYFSAIPAGSGMSTKIPYHVVNSEQGRFQISENPTGEMIKWSIPSTLKTTYYIYKRYIPTANIAFFLNSGKYLSTGSYNRASPDGTIRFVNTIATPAGIAANVDYQAVDAGNTAFTLTLNGTQVNWSGTGYGYYIFV